MSLWSRMNILFKNFESHPIATNTDTGQILKVDSDAKKGENNFDNPRQTIYRKDV